MNGPRLAHALIDRVATLCIAEHCDRAMRAHVEVAYPHEGCGVLVGTQDLGTATVSRVVAMVNRNVQRGRDRFEIDPADYLAVEKSLPRNETILGFFHSHPDCPAQASATDREFARFWPGFVWLIYRVDGGRVVDRRGWLLGPTDEWLPLATATG